MVEVTGRFTRIKKHVILPPLDSLYLADSFGFIWLGCDMFLSPEHQENGGE